MRVATRPRGSTFRRSDSEVPRGSSPVTIWASFPAHAGDDAALTVSPDRELALVGGRLTVVAMTPNLTAEPAPPLTRSKQKSPVVRAVRGSSSGTLRLRRLGVARHSSTRGEGSSTGARLALSTTVREPLRDRPRSMA